MSDERSALGLHADVSTVLGKFYTYARDLEVENARTESYYQDAVKRAEAAEAAIEEALLLLGGIDHDEGSRIGRAIEALEKTCR